MFNVGRVKTPFPNNTKSLILYWERLLKNIQDSCQFSQEWMCQKIITKVMQSKVTQSSEKLQKTQELHLQLYKPQLNVKVKKKTEQLPGRVAWLEKKYLKKQD